MNYTNIRDIEQVFKVVLNSANKLIYTWPQCAKEVVRRTVDFRFFSEKW
jgi:hypothetical protein